MHDAAAPDVDAARQLGIVPHGLERSLAREGESVGKSGVGQAKVEVRGTSAGMFVTP